MKKYSLLLVLNVLLLGLILPSQYLSAQSNKDSAKLKMVTDLVNNQGYRFVAQQMTPMSARQRQLDSQYDLKVTKQEVVADLPYFGTAYQSPVNPAESGIKFTSKDYIYNLTKRKRDGWEVLIKTKDITDQQNLNLTIYSNGNASLQVTSNSRQGISFNGYIVAPDKEKTN